MKIAVHVLGYNVTRFAAAVIANALPHVDRMYVAYSRRPWVYNKLARDNFENPTAISEFTNSTSDGKLRIIEGDWLTEEEMRNACLDAAECEGMDWLITQDADEYYTEKSWGQIKSRLLVDKYYDQFLTTWYNFWKSSQYVLVQKNGEIKTTNANFALRCGKGHRFINRRQTNALRTGILDASCYHYGYVMSDSEMHEKLSTWGHAHETNPRVWFEDKWLAWGINSSYLHPVHPRYWRCAIRFPLEQPDFADQFSLPVVPVEVGSRKRGSRIREWSSDRKVELRAIAAHCRDYIA